MPNVSGVSSQCSRVPLKKETVFLYSLSLPVGEGIAEPNHLCGPTDLEVHFSPILSIQFQMPFLMSLLQLVTAISTIIGIALRNDVGPTWDDVAMFPQRLEIGPIGV